MSDNDLRLRTAKALGWVEIGREVFPWYRDQTKIETTISYERGDNRVIAYLLDGKPSWDNCWSLPLYGTSWASCEEIDAECKKRGWILMHDGDKDGDRVVLTGSRRGLFPVDLGEAFAPTFPAAFAEAFCQAVEASRE